MAANINEIVGLIRLTEPKVLEALQDKFSDYLKILEPGKTLGNDTAAVDAKEIFIRATVCISGLQVVLRTCDINLPVLKKRLKKLGNLQLVSQIIVAITGATLLTQSQQAFPGIKMVTGALALIGSIITLYAQHKSGTVLNNSQSIFSYYDKLVDNKFEAEALRQEIDIELQVFDANNPSDKLSDMINRGNKICLEIRKTLDKI